MNKKIASSVLAALMMAALTSITTIAAMKNGTMVIGDKAFDLGYSNDPLNMGEITNAIVEGGPVYVKNFNGDWIDNVTGLPIATSLIPAVVYKDGNETIGFDAADTNQVVKETAYPKTFTSVTNEITNISNFAYFTAVDQYGKDFNIVTDSSYKVTATVNGVPLSDAEIRLDTDRNMAKITINKKLTENDAVVIMLEKFDKDAVSSTAELVSSISNNYTVGKDEPISPKSILSVTTSADTVLVGDAAVILRVDVRDQYNNPTDLSINKLRWIVEVGGNLLDSTSDLNSSKLTLDTTVNTVTFKAIKAGTVTISAYNILNGVKVTYTVEVGATKLTGLTLTSENPITKFNNEDVKYNKITQNNGALLTPDMIKFNVTPKTSDISASDIVVTASLRGGTDYYKNNIVISARTLKAGNYEVTPYIGTSFDAEDTIKAAKFDVVTTINPVTTTIDSITLPKLKVNTKQNANLVIRNANNEVIDVAGDNVTALVYSDDGITSNNVIVEKLDKDGQVATTGVVKSLRFEAKAAGNYIININVNGTVATYNLEISAEVTTLKSIELGNNIGDNSIIANATAPVYRVLSVVDNKGDEIIPDITNWRISTKNGIKEASGFASLIYYKHDAQGSIIETDFAGAQGLAVKFDPSKTSVNSFVENTTLIVTVGNKAIDEVDVIKDTLNVIVRAKSAIKSITIVDVNVSLIVGVAVKKEIVVLDQYGKVITDPTMVKIVNGTKVIAVVNYDDVDKKMYVTYTGVITGTDSIVVESVVDSIIKATANVTIGNK
ncbi:MAG TPA: hypothetical protein VIM70_09435 [Clostridium sp.]|uniref:hypothetical protein n=1 Tax=Clostridium sp. TaxID=1506 RepID=UPI002F93236B